MARWTKETAFAVAKKYTDFRTFDREMAGCYKFLKRHGWLDEATIHMSKGQKVIWTFEALKKVVASVSSRKELYKLHRSAYNRVQKDGLLDILFTDKEKVLSPSILKFKNARKAEKQFSSYTQVELGAFYQLTDGGRVFLERGTYIVQKANGNFCSITEDKFKQRELKYA